MQGLEVGGMWVNVCGLVGGWVAEWGRHNLVFMCGVLGRKEWASWLGIVHVQGK